VPGGRLPDGRRSVALPKSLAQTAVLRRPMAGDTIRPFGAAGSKPLRRYLTDRKVDPPFRSCLPVIASGKQVLWAVGLGASESTRTGQEPSVLYTLQGDLPWLNL
jgi:tRNA(Ile)-lysidine synthase